MGFWLVYNRYGVAARATSPSSKKNIVFGESNNDVPCAWFEVGDTTISIAIRWIFVSIMGTRRGLIPGRCVRKSRI